MDRSSSRSVLAISLFVGGVMGVHDVLVPRQGTPSSSSSAASASTSTITLPPYLYFQSIPQAVTCKPLTVSWFYNGLDGAFSFYATNAGVSQAGTPPSLSMSSSLASLPSSLALSSLSSSSLSSSLPSSSSLSSTTATIARRAVPTSATSDQQSLTVQIATSIAGSKAGFTWSAVTVPQGWYIINATMQSQPYSVSSSLFYVHTGTNTSCLVSITSSTPSPGSASTSSINAVGGSSTGGAKIGIVIGATLGIIALVATIFAAILCLLHRRKNLAASGGGGGGKFRKGLVHRWKGLSSNDSKGGFTGSSATKRVPQRHQVYRTESAGTIPMTSSEEGVSAEKNSTMTKFDDDSTSNGHGLGLAYLPVLPQHSQSPRAKASAVGRTYSACSSASGNGFPQQDGLSAPTPAPVRKSSVPDSMLGGRRSLDSTTYPPLSPKRNSVQAQAPSRSHSMNASHPTTTLNRTPSKPTAQYSSPMSPQNDNNNNNNNSAVSPTSPGSPVDFGATPLKRQSLGSRKRKPVPAYDPNQDPSSPVSPAVSPVPPLPSPSPLPPNPAPNPNPSRPNTATANTNGGAHYTTRSQLEQDQTQQPTLAHKSSFGPGGVEGKPLHYLIPDMPMPVHD